VSREAAKNYPVLNAIHLIYQNSKIIYVWAFGDVNKDRIPEFDIHEPDSIQE